MTGIICAMEAEARQLIQDMESMQQETISGVSFVRGTLYGREVIVAVCGVGKVFAAMCAQTMLLHYKPTLIINTGVAGSLSQKLHIGDIVVASEVVQHDMDTTAAGDALGEISGICKVLLPCDAHAAKHMLSCIAETEGLRGEMGIIATGDQFVSNAERKAFIVGTFGAMATEMEGAAVGQVCYVNGVPFCVLRAISDEADDSASMDYLAFVKLAAENSRRVLERFLRTYA